MATLHEDFPKNITPLFKPSLVDINGSRKTQDSKYEELVAVAKSLKPQEELSQEDVLRLQAVAGLDWNQSMLCLDREHDVEWIAKAAALGVPVLHGFGNFLAISARPEPEVFRFVNKSKGRPLDQVSSVVTTRKNFDQIWDFDKLPQGLTAEAAMKIIDDFYQIGPFGFLAPAKENIPVYLTSTRPGSETRQTQLIAPGYNCRSMAMYERIFDITGLRYGTITSANISHTLTGNKVEPAHYSMSGAGNNGARKDFADRGYAMIAFPNEKEVRQNYPKHDPNSTSIVALDTIVYDHTGPNLVLERLGSLPAERIAEVLKEYGFGLRIGPNAVSRQPLRIYEPQKVE